MSEFDELLDEHHWKDRAELAEKRLDIAVRLLSKTPDYEGEYMGYTWDVVRNKADES